jgi:hypothetical protein
LIVTACLSTMSSRGRVITTKRRIALLVCRRGIRSFRHRILHWFIGTPITPEEESFSPQIDQKILGGMGFCIEFHNTTTGRKLSPSI